MSRKKLFAILAAESVAIIALYVLTAQMQETFSAIYNFPFEQIGLGLRALHGLGGFGVGAAFALWIGFSLLPMIPAVCGRRKSAWEKRRPRKRTTKNQFCASAWKSLRKIRRPFFLRTSEKGENSRLTVLAPAI